VDVWDDDKTENSRDPCLSSGDEQSQPPGERCCAAWASAKPYGSVTADLDLARTRARQLGPTRMLAGVVLLVRPQLLTAALGLSGGGKAGWWLCA
jgi:hypothetical protein